MKKTQNQNQNQAVNQNWFEAKSKDQNIIS